MGSCQRPLLSAQARLTVQFWVAVVVELLVTMLHLEVEVQEGIVHLTTTKHLVVEVLLKMDIQL